ncbi:bilirubin oxidase [Colletotrichum tofieldiae]|uniref:Bilirubin oxidase n=1 Tax=Colletotrichum tofieldiae TaxID=708197 RepID=A0A166RY37_9PEZI|nr:bilirubin oxidase [Colletotrichum tofieldiae]
MISLTLRQFLAVVVALAPSTLAKDWESPEYKWLYEFPLPIPPPKTEKFPNQPIINPVTGKKIRHYEIEIKEFTSQVYPSLGPAKLVGYDGISPGPTFGAWRGSSCPLYQSCQDGKLRPSSRFSFREYFSNLLDMRSSTDKIAQRTPWDGWAEDTTGVNEFKDYYYPNSQNARTLWYHDHAIDHTAENAYFGQAGAYLLHDSAEDSLGLPAGYGVYDIPLILSAKQYNQDGSLYSPANEQTSLYGDVIHVNGQPWPYLKVEPRKYRFRLLDAAISRTFLLYLEDAKQERVGFDVISSDTGLLTGPQKVKELYISMAERYEIIVDFSKYKGQNVTMRNTRGFAPDVDYLHTDKVMRFVVSGDSVSDKSEVPSALRAVPFPKDKTGVDQHFLFHRQGSDWRINGVIFADVNNRVLARPKRGTIEVWELENSSGGGWSHPIHIHLVDFRVIKRINGRGGVVFPYESQGLKDVVWVGPGETVTVEAHYTPWPGVYMFHCHNLIHEDHEMMAAFNVSVLTDLGYNETQFADPMETEWRAKKEDPAAYKYDAIKSRIEYMARFQPYNRIDEVESKLDAYWATKTNSPSASSTASTLVVSTTSSSSVAGATAKTTSAAPSASSSTTAKATTTSKVDDSKKSGDDKKKTSGTTTSSKKKRGLHFRG